MQGKDSGNYSSPTEARAKRCRADSGTVYRDRRRTPADRESAQLARKLGNLAEQFPRFRGSLCRLQHHVLVQVRSAQWKCQAVLQCLGTEPELVEEIVEETNLDKQSATETLEALVTEGAAERCNRNGGPILTRRDGKPAENVYWRRASRQAAGAGGQVSDV